MRATFIKAPGQIEIRDIPVPAIARPTDAIVEITASCVCGSDLWSYRGVKAVPEPAQIGHEYIGVVTEVGTEVRDIKVGDFVVGPFTTSDNTCPHCKAGVQSACQNITYYLGCQAEYTRVPNADGTLVRVDAPTPELIPSLLACSDVMGTGWHAAVSAGAGPGKTAVVVGDGAVGLCGIIAAKQLGAERIVAMSRHEQRQKLAREFGATDVIEERGRDGVEMPLEPYFRRNIGLRGGMAPVRAYLPDLIDLVLAGTIDPGKVFDLTLPLDEAAEAYRAMDERRAIKVLLTP